MTIRTAGNIRGKGRGSEHARGLGEIWQDILEKLAATVENYEKVNNLMSILVLQMVRKAGVEALLNTRAEGPLLDAGSGPGVMTRVIVEEHGSKHLEERHLVLMDPLREMLERIPYKSEPWIDRVRGVFEHPPFRDSSFAGIMASFSLRDAYSYPKAVLMLSRILRPCGRIVFLDISKPQRRLGQKLVELYFTIAPVVMGIMVLGYRGFSIYISMRDTLERYLPYSLFESLFRKRGLRVATKRMFLGFVHIMVGEKDCRGNS